VGGDPTLGLSAASFLEDAFLRWVLRPAALPGIAAFVTPQREVLMNGHRYLVDYSIETPAFQLALELDGFAFHGNLDAFNYDRLRQNDLVAAGWSVIRFSYENIKFDTTRCVAQLQDALAVSSVLRPFLIANPVVDAPDMPSEPLFAMSAAPSVAAVVPATYFDGARSKLNLKTLRTCQFEAFGALSNYYLGGGANAATVMSVGAGKTALGVVAALAFSRKRALIVTPGSVIRGTFDRALDHTALGNVLYGLPGGPLIPGVKPPKSLVLDREDGPIRSITTAQLLAAQVLVTNFHSLGTGSDPDDLLSKLGEDDIDFIVIDEAHIAASASYQRLFKHFPRARTLLMSACFQRLDGRPIEADVVYRYRLIDSIADGNAKNLRVNRFAPNAQETIYEMVWPDGAREEIVGREALLELVASDRNIASIVAKSDASIRQVMRVVRERLDVQVALLDPVKPRVLFSALGHRHAEQIARIAEEYGIACGVLHHTMTDGQIKAVRDRFERDSGDLQAIVQLKMLGQGYDFPPVTIVVPMRPYGSFAEFYQFVGRGIRNIVHPALIDRVEASDQFLDIVYHAEFGLDEHLDTIYRENDMDPKTVHVLPDSWDKPDTATDSGELGSDGRETAEHPDTFVLFESGAIEARVVHDAARVEQRRHERAREALAARYSAYAQSTTTPVTFEQFMQILQLANG
jgi:superfamily II DNA or RNA helicase/very-short-patch-repair endonuclease